MLFKMFRGLRRNTGILEDQDFGIGLWNNKGENIMKKQFGLKIKKEGSLSEKCGSVEYTMSAALAQHIIKTHKGPKKNQQDILCGYVNSQLGLKGHCTKVLVELDKL